MTMSSRATCVLDHMSAPRFALLQRCLAASQPFSASQVMALDNFNSRANARDLAALEQMDLISGLPPIGTKRQGRRIMYSVNEDTAAAIFEEIAAAARTSLEEFRANNPRPS